MIGEDQCISLCIAVAMCISYAMQRKEVPSLVIVHVLDGFELLFMFVHFGSNRCLVKFVAFELPIL